MYASHHMTAKQRSEAVAERILRKWPWHAPPHFENGANLYLLTAACWQHRPLLTAPYRRDEWQTIIFAMERALSAELRAWVIMPTHYHVLARVDLESFRTWIGRQHNGAATRWNREDSTPGRKVWYRFADRRIRSERHFRTALNYIHANPVKHGFAVKAQEWEWSSVHAYARDVGLSQLRDWWKTYPVLDFGKDWDE